MTTMGYQAPDDVRVEPAAGARPRRSLDQRLASAYAERLSLLRSDGTDAELAESTGLIAVLEHQYRSRWGAAEQPQLIELPDVDGQPRTELRLDPTLYLG